MFIQKKKKVFYKYTNILGIFSNLFNLIFRRLFISTRISRNYFYLFYRLLPDLIFARLFYSYILL